MYLSKRLTCTVELYETIPFYSLLTSYSQMQICLGFGKVSPRPFFDNERGFAVQKIWSHNEIIAATITNSATTTLVNYFTLIIVFGKCSEYGQICRDSLSG